MRKKWNIYEKMKYFRHKYECVNELHGRMAYAKEIIKMPWTYEEIERQTVIKNKRVMN